MGMGVFRWARYPCGDCPLSGEVVKDDPEQYGPFLEGHLAHKQFPPPRTIQQAYAWDPTVVLRGRKFRMGEVYVPL